LAKACTVLTECTQNTIESDEGSILFGAIDQKKFVGSLATMELHPDELSGQDEALHFNVKLTGFHANTPDNADDIDLSNLDSFAVLDSGSTICLMPDDQVKAIHEEFGVVAIDGLLAPFADCAWRGDKGKGYSFDFKFEGKVIRVPMSEMIVNAYEEIQEELMRDPEARRLFGDWDSVCIFGIGSTADFGFEGDGFTLLGDTFLRSAYVVYDLANEQLGLAQAVHDSDESDIVDITSGDLPKVQGVEGQSDLPKDPEDSENDNDQDQDQNDDDGQDDDRQGSEGPVTRTVTVSSNQPTGADFGDDDDAAILLSNPFREGAPAAVGFMGFMAAVMVML
jgi:hypothetical protein